MSYRQPSQPMPFPQPSTPPIRPATPTSPSAMDVSSTPLAPSTSLPSTSSIQFPLPPSSTPFPSVPNYPVSPMRPGVLGRRRPSLLSLAIERTNKPSLAGTGLGGPASLGSNGNGNGAGAGAGTGAGLSSAFMESPILGRRPRGYTSVFPTSSSSSLSMNDSAMLSPTPSQREDSGMITPLEEPISLSILVRNSSGSRDSEGDRGRSRERRNGIIGGDDPTVRDLPLPKTPPRSMSDGSVITLSTPGLKRGLPIKPSRLLMLQSELTALPNEVETRSEAAFQRLVSSSSDLAQTLGLPIPGAGRRTRKKSGLGNRYPESVGGESDRDIGSRDRGGNGADHGDSSSSDENDEETFVLHRDGSSANWEMDMGVGSIGLGDRDGREAMSGGSVMDVDMNDRSALSSPRSSISAPFHWRGPPNPAYNRPGKRKFSDAQLLDPHSGGPMAKRRRGGSPAPFPPPRSPVVHARNSSNPWQARMPSAMNPRYDSNNGDLMDGAMSARSSPVMRPSSSSSSGGMLGITGISIGSSLLGLSANNGHSNGNNGSNGGGAGVGIPINIPAHVPVGGMIGMGTSPGSAMGMYMMAAAGGTALGLGSGGSPSLRPMHRLPRRAIGSQVPHQPQGGGQGGGNVQDGVNGLRLGESG